MSIAQTIIEKCGGVAKTAKIAERTESVVHRWTYDRDKGGTGGTVPYKAQVKILAAAARGEVDVAPSDFFEAAK